MNKRNKNGSIYFVVLLLVILAVASVLSFVFWKNFINKDNVVKNEEGQTGHIVHDIPKKELITGRIDSLFPASLTWNYPANWSIESQGSGPHSEAETAEQIISLTSPSGNYQVVYRISANGGLGGTCDPKSAGNIHYIRKEPIDKFDKTLFVEYIKNVDPWDGIEGEVNSNNYTYESSILNGRASVQQAQVDSSFCDLYLAEVINLSEKYNTRLLSAEIKIKDLDSAEKQGLFAQNINDIKKYYEDIEYKQAVDILLSTKKE